MTSFPEIFSKSTAGVHLVIDETGQRLLRAVILKKSGRSVVIREKFTDPFDIDEAEQYFSGNIPVILSLDGEGIIHRRISVAADSDPLLRVLPNANPADFYVQTAPGGDSLLLVSFIRADIIRDVLNEFSSKGINIVKIFLGPLSVNFIIPVIEPEGKINAGQYDLTTENGVLACFEPSLSAKDEVIKAAGEEIENHLLIPYSNAISWFTSGDCNITASADLTADSYYRHIFQRRISLAVTGFLAAVFLMLLINFFVFSSFRSRLASLQSQYRSGLELVDRVNILQEELTGKQILIKENNLLTGTRYSYYADVIGASLPANIVLTEMEINPVQNAGGAREISVIPGKILVKGKSQSGQILKGWMDTLKSETWIKSVEMSSYTQENISMPGNFLIEITY